MVGGLLLSQVAHALHDAGDLRVLRSPRAARPAARGARHEPLGAVHPPAGRDHAARRSRSRSPGVVAFTVLPVSPLPQVDFPTISVAASLPGRERRDHGRDGRDAARAPVRRASPGITEMTSTQPARHARAITLQFDLSRNIDGAARDVQAAINAARSYLPANLPANPTLPQGQPRRRADHDPQPDVATSTATGQLYDFASTVMAQRLSQIAGRRPGHGRRLVVPGGARRGRPDAAQQLRPRAARRRSRCSSMQNSDLARGQIARRADDAPTSSPTARSRAPRTTGRSSSGRTTARPSGCPTSPTSSTACRTSAPPATWTASRR